MSELIIRGLTLGTGRPKICVPISFESADYIQSEIERLRDAAADIIEWRVDGFNSWREPDSVLSALQTLRNTLDIPIIFTCRTSSDGGAASPGAEYYVNLLKAVAESENADIIDVELNTGEAAVCEIVEAAERSGTKTILSFHNFVETPPAGEIGALLNKMLLFRADIYKVAYMPGSKEDTLALMSAATKFLEKNPQKQLISIAMGELGAITRIMAGFLNSPLTFGSAGRESAPGQIDSKRLLELLEIV